MFDFSAVSLIVAKAAVLLLLTTVVAFGARRASAAIRHLIWTTGLFATLLLPIVPLAVPSWPTLPTLPSLSEPLPAIAAALTPDAVVTFVDEAPAEPAFASPSLASAPAAVTIASEPAPAVAGPGSPAFAEGSGTPRWFRFLLSVWALGAAAAGTWLLAGIVGLRRLARRAIPLESPAWIETVEDVLDDRTFRRPLRFLESETIPTPCTWGIYRPVILLPTAGAEWTAMRRRHVVIHELAHVARFDCLTHLVSRIVCAIHWFNPLVWLAARAARVAREQACDDAVLNDGGLPSEYADLLLDTARTAPFGSDRPTVALAIAHRSQLGDRLLAVLDPSRRRRGLDRGAVALAGFGAISLLLPLGAVTPREASVPEPAWAAPVAAAPSPTQIRLEPALAPLAALAPVTGIVVQDPDRCRPGQGGTERTYRMSSSTTITGEGTATDDEGNRMVVWTGSDCAVAVRSRRNPQFTAAEDDVASLPKGGRFEITYERGKTERRYVVVERNGALERRYTIDGRETELDPATARWRQLAILEFIRRSGYEAEARVARIMKTSGFDGLVREIEQIDGDGGKSTYLGLALRAPGVTSAQVTELLAQTGTIESDGDQAQVLAAIPLALLLEPAVSAEYLAAVRRIESDGDKTTVLTRLVRQRPTAKTLGIVLDLASTIDSDGDRTSLLTATIDAYPNTATLPEAFYTAARGIDSDGDLSSLLTHALRSGKVEAASREQFLDLVNAIESDGDRASTLIRFLEGGLDGDLVPAFFKAADGIDSDGDKASVLSRVLATSNPTDEVVAALLSSARGISSDGDRSSVLVRAARRGLVRTPALRRAYLRAAEDISSDGDRETALRAVGERPAEP